jgi:hypothetical protein
MTPSTHKTKRDSPSPSAQELSAAQPLPLLIKVLLEEVKQATKVPNTLKGHQKEARDRLFTETIKFVPRKDELPIPKASCEKILRRLIHRLVYFDKATIFVGATAQKALVRQVVAEAKLAMDLGFTPREVDLSLHKVTLADLAQLSSLYPKAIIERALTRPSPLKAAMELAQKRAAHEAWIAKRMAEMESASLANGARPDPKNSVRLKAGKVSVLIASKSFRKREPKNNPFGAAEKLLSRFLSDVKFFTEHLPEASLRSARHLATRSFYGPLKKRHGIVRELSALEAFLTKDGRADRHKIRADILQRTVGVAANPVLLAKKLLSGFEREYRALQRLLPGQPLSVYRGLAIRASMTASSDRAEQKAAAHGRAPIPVDGPSLAARYEEIMSRFKLQECPHVGWLLGLGMTLNPSPQERFRSQISTIRRSLKVQEARCDDTALLKTIDAEFAKHPLTTHGFLRRGLLCRFTSLQPGQMQRFGRFREEIQKALPRGLKTT